MIKYLRGDLFKSPAQVIVNTVNTVGVMGKGIALEYKKRYPDMYLDYKKACETKKLRNGRLMLWYGPDHWILLFPTKEHWRGSSKIEYIEAGLREFREYYAEYNITSIAFPKLGCGNGGLEWKDVRPLMEKYLKDLPIDIYVYLSTLEQQKETETGEVLDMMYSEMLNSIIQKTSMVPMEIEFEDNRWEVLYNFNTNELGFSSRDGLEETISEEEIHVLWDKICAEKVLTNDYEVSKRLYLDLLRRIGYLSKVSIGDSDGEMMEDGFQVDAGKGRQFLVKA